MYSCRIVANRKRTPRRETVLEGGFVTRKPYQQIEHYTSEEVGNLFGVSAATVNTWARLGKIPAVKTPGGGRWLFLKKEVETHLQRHRAD